MRTLVVIPARGGSKGVPRKNLRPLHGKPLIAWVIAAATRATRVDRVVVSTDSAEIAAVARRFGAEALMRNASLAGDAVTLDPVVEDAVLRIENDSEPFDCVLTVQPTSPLLQSRTIDAIVERLELEPEVDSILTAVDDTHLSWTLNSDGKPVPEYAERLNRQQLPKRFRETGGVLATRRRHVTSNGRIGSKVGLQVVSTEEGLDIDTHVDWLFAEAALGRKSVAFAVIGNRATGLGHVTRVMTLMEGLSGHRTCAFVDPTQDLAIQRLADAFFPYEVVNRDQRLAALERFGADLVVHDELDTRREDLDAERSAGMRIVCFEDRGAGLTAADCVVNALYPEEESQPAAGKHFGPSVYVLRDDFFHCERRPPRDRVGTALVTFGGTDPSRLTFKVLDALVPLRWEGRLVVVAGKGFEEHEELDRRSAKLRETGVIVDVLHDVALMSDVMRDADIAFSSAGRTVYELAYMQIPTIVMSQNELELKHTFAGPENGCLNLGLGARASDEEIRSAFTVLVESRALRESLRRRMAALDLARGREKVLRLLLGEPWQT